MTLAANKKGTGMHFIKTGLMIFWGLWFLIAFLTNLFDFLGTHNSLPQNWYFRSGNYALIISTIRIYQLSSAWAVFFFICDILIQGWAAILFMLAAYNFWKHKKPWFWINLAFGVSIALWALFILMDELFIAYNYEGTHIGLIMLELIVLIAIHVLPDKRSGN